MALNIHYLNHAQYENDRERRASILGSACLAKFAAEKGLMEMRHSMALSGAVFKRAKFDDELMSGWPDSCEFIDILKSEREKEAFVAAMQVLTLNAANASGTIEVMDGMTKLAHAIAKFCGINWEADELDRLKPWVMMESKPVGNEDLH